MKNVHDYLYISQRRINMIFEQLIENHRPQQNIEKSISFNLAFVNTSLTEKNSLDEKNIFKKIDSIYKYLNQSHNIGDIQSDLEYIEGEMLMRYCYWSGGVFFGGKIENYILGMLGPEENLMHRKAKEIENVYVQGSDLYDQISSWSHFLENSKEKSKTQKEIIETNPPNDLGHLAVVRRGVSELQSFTEGYAEYKMTFLAKNHGFGYDRDGKKVICASPIFVYI
jgi:hypothetical protein